MNDHHHIRVPLTWSIAVSVVIAAIAWGVNTGRVGR